ncbi:hypothetical protein ACFVKB_34390 [Rhodococcus sp. NPDC127530]|uniref:hypothetical protein n=1 Tax=unclassified Rhodococcus (in: high G+C Gram-positive bacteria) TaxID=192944 RepID=UPI00363C68AC
MTSRPLNGSAQSESAHSTVTKITDAGNAPPAAGRRRVTFEMKWASAIAVVRLFSRNRNDVTNNLPRAV